MADNLSILNDDSTDQGTLALDEVTYSGDTALVGISRVVHVSGSEGSKVVSEVFFAEDAAHTNGDYGLQILAVRNDTLAALAGTDGDYAPLQVNSSGALYVEVASHAVRDRLTDNVGVALQTDALLDDETALTPKFAAINATVNGDNTIVAAVVGKKIRVVSYALVTDAAVGVAFEDGAGGSELSGQMACAANGGVVVPFSPIGWFETTANTLLNLETDAAANVRGHLVYVEV